jgi:uncharacterized protein YukE
MTHSSQRRGGTTVAALHEQYQQNPNANERIQALKRVDEELARIDAGLRQADKKEETKKAK